MQEVYVFALNGNDLVVLDLEHKQELKIDVSTYDRMECKKLIGTKIIVEETENGYDFAGASILKLIDERGIG